MYLTITAAAPPSEESGIVLVLENSAGDECSISIGAEDAKALTSAIHTLTNRY